MTPDDLSVLSTRWLEVFEASARATDQATFKGLFHPDAILFGVEKGGAVDWPLKLAFKFDIERARVVPSDPFAVVIVEWSMQPLVIGGDGRKGRATLLLTVEGGKRFLCLHAHFSLKT
jgi:hypothetical protein